MPSCPSRSGIPAGRSRGDITVWNPIVDQQGYRLERQMLTWVLQWLVSSTIACGNQVRTELSKVCLQPSIVDHSSPTWFIAWQNYTVFEVPLKINGTQACMVHFATTVVLFEIAGRNAVILPTIPNCQLWMETLRVVVPKEDNYSSHTHLLKSRLLNVSACLSLWLKEKECWQFSSQGIAYNICVSTKWVARFLLWNASFTASSLVQDFSSELQSCESLWDESQLCWLLYVLLCAVCANEILLWYIMQTNSFLNAVDARTIPRYK